MPAQPTLRFDRPGHACAWTLLFLLGYFAASVLGFLHWYLPTGLLFTALWLLRTRDWPWIFIATIVARTLHGLLTGYRSHLTAPFLGRWMDPQLYLLGDMLDPFLAATGVLLLRHFGVRPDNAICPEQVAKLQLAMLLSATALVLKDLAYVSHEGRINDIRLSVITATVSLHGPSAGWAMIAFGLKNLLGHFIAMLLVAPIATWITVPAHRRGSAPALREAGLYLLPLMVLLVSVATLSPLTRLAELLRLVQLISVAVFTMRHGWRGAVLSIFTASLAVALQEHLGTLAESPIWMQTFLAIMGGMALLYGATVDGLKQQQAQLQLAGQEASHMAEALHAAAQRNLHAEERERRRLAAELHDEFGQNLTALQTHLKAAERQFVEAGLQPVADQLFAMMRGMRHNIVGVLERLRPSALDQLGLYGAIDRGSLRALAEAAGLQFTTRLEGDARLLEKLGDTERLAAYRCAQEAITNVVRHAHASQCQVRLRLNERATQLWLFIEIRDDGRGHATRLRMGGGLIGLRDRLSALGGTLHLSNLEPGLRLHALVRQAVSA